MIDEEVESVLREIRERVISQPVAEQVTASSTALRNGDGKPQTVTGQVTEVQNSEALARLQAHLTTTARAWDRLPPIFSNRRGTAARFELWVKARLKVFTRWFTWEQVNFNAAVHHALGEAVEALGQQEAARAQADNENQILRDEVQSQRAVIDAQSAELNSLREKLQADAASRRLDLQNQQKDMTSLRGELEAIRIQADVQRTELSAQREVTAELSRQADELHERSSVNQNEQHVCYKQLSLEMSEAALAQDRAHRQTNATLEELNQRIAKLEGSDKRAAKP